MEKIKKNKKKNKKKNFCIRKKISNKISKKKKLHSPLKMVKKCGGEYTFCIFTPYLLLK